MARISESGQPQVQVTRDWVGGSGQIHCFRSKTANCRVTLLETKNRTTFHDEELAKATTEINSLLGKISAQNKDSSKELAILTTTRGLFLAWVRTDTTWITADSDVSEVDKFLGIS